MPKFLYTLVTTLAFVTVVHAEDPAPTVTVTADNFKRAETDMYFANMVKDGGFGKFVHHREVMDIDHQTVIRANRDTLYSAAVFDLDAGPVTVVFPNAGKRFMSMQIITEDHYVPAVIYRPGTYTLSRKQVGTRYVMVAFRTLVDPNDPEDVKKAHALQDAIEVRQKASGEFEVPNWDTASQTKIRQALKVLGETLPDSRNTFGPKGAVDPVRHLIGTAIAWGGNPLRDAMYLNVTPAKNDGETVHTMTIKDVPVDGFWSISVYNAEGYFEKNPQNAYTINNITGEKSADGSITIQFGGCTEQTVNCLPITKGWNYLFRLYRPRQEILNSRWKIPEAKPVAPAFANYRLRINSR